MVVNFCKLHSFGWICMLLTVLSIVDRGILIVGSRISSPDRIMNLQAWRMYEDSTWKRGSPRDFYLTLIVINVLLCTCFDRPQCFNALRAFLIVSIICALQTQRAGNLPGPPHWPRGEIGSCTHSTPVCSPLQWAPQWPGSLQFASLLFLSQKNSQFSLELNILMLLMWAKLLLSKNVSLLRLGLK